MLEHFLKPPALATPPWAEIKVSGKTVRQEKVRYGPGLRTHEEALALLIGKVKPFRLA
jgi:hypothetical protein